MESLVKIENLSVSFYTHAGEVEAIRNISFEIPKGKCVSIVGESGCGKTVTAKTIMGLSDYFSSVPKEGSKVIFEDKNILEFSQKEWQEYRGGKVSMIFQDAMVSLNPTTCIGKQVAEVLQIHKNMSKKDSWDEAIRLLEKVGIHNAAANAKRYPHEFSGGMRQRAMIAMAIACEPKLLIADEPTTALDVTMQAQIIELIKELQKEREMSVLFITHDLGIVSGMAQVIVVMYNGIIVEIGNPQEIFYGHKHPYTEALLQSALRVDCGKDQTLYSIEGTPPSLINPPKGCPFAERCPYAMNICVEARPAMKEFEKGHLAACWKNVREEA